MEPLCTVLADRAPFVEHAACHDSRTYNRWHDTVQQRHSYYDRTDHQRFRLAGYRGRNPHSGSCHPLCRRLCRRGPAGTDRAGPRQPPLGPNAGRGDQQRAGGRGAIDDQRRHRRHADDRRARAASRRGRRNPDHGQPQPVALQRPEAVFRRRARHSGRPGRKGLAAIPHRPSRLGRARPPGNRRTADRHAIGPPGAGPGDGRAGADPQAPLPRAAWTPITAPAARWAGACWRNSAAP